MGSGLQLAKDTGTRPPRPPAPCPRPPRAGAEGRWTAEGVGKGIERERGNKGRKEQREKGEGGRGGG